MDFDRDSVTIDSMTASMTASTFAPRAIPPRWRRAGSAVTFVLAASAIVTTGAERVFWFWTTSPIAHLEVIAFYTTSVVALFWVLHRYGVHDLASLVLTLPIFAYMTEGVLTPVLYSGGPFVPIFPLWFTA